jgi:hypothetical protein
MEEKRKRIDEKMKGAPAGKGKGAKKGKAKEEGQDLADIARSIAGERIEKLKKSRSQALADKESPSKDDVVELIEDIQEIDTSVKKKDQALEAEKVREKLKAFFDRFPMMAQLDDARSHFEKGEKLLEKGKSAGAVKEYRVAMSIAIKIGKVHMDMTKALKTVRTTLDKLKKKGFESGGAEDLYSEGKTLLKEGDLLGCARTIKSIREELAKME